MSNDFVEKLSIAKTKAKDAQEEGRLLLQETISDDSIHLFDRWCLFMANSDLFFPKPQWGLDDATLENYILNQRDLDRYREYSFSEEIFSESWVDPEDRDDEHYEAHYALSEECFSEIPEDIVTRVLNSGVSGFTHDW
ncbi:MAG: DUF7020 family protein [Cetobacterium sp.]|uniref:DUF7020 family protein n=1 Tax=Cetobacterium sp. TaxID=2071632 RepID=UPI003EE81837